MIVKQDLDAGLAIYAASQDRSHGRKNKEIPHPYRGEFQRDRDRIIHSSSFRRLVYKTQVFVNHEGDLYRTRLTHSLEVAQIARTIASSLRLNEQLAEAICLAHDLGHTPFGHAGQDALNKAMKIYGGFEHNLQSLRVVETLEKRYVDFDGLNLCFETKEGILKHCSKRNAIKLGKLGDRFLKSEQPSLEAQLSNLADEMAYNNHDVDDGIRAGLLEIDDLCAIPLFGESYNEVQAHYKSLDAREQARETVRRMINLVVTDLLLTTTELLSEFKPESIDEVRSLPQPLVSFSSNMLFQHRELKQFLQKALYQHPRVMEMTERASLIVNGLFELYFSDITVMPKEHEARASSWGEEIGDSGRARAVADYIAGMTDRYALSAYRNLIDAKLEV
ncbi:MAG: deoxyguanosinetriphosphate triphosphohydrolase [Pseudomonadota bacterium]|nr:deoxyguanosinetriphosphate triphosphohydrolase [Pseudomonadota bacterium]